MIAVLRFRKKHYKGTTSYGVIAKILLAYGADPNAKDDGGSALDHKRT